MGAHGGGATRLDCTAASTATTAIWVNPYDWYIISSAGCTSGSPSPLQCTTSTIIVLSYYYSTTVLGLTRLLLLPLLYYRYITVLLLYYYHSTYMPLLHSRYDYSTIRMLLLFYLHTPTGLPRVRVPAAAALRYAYYTSTMPLLHYNPAATVPFPTYRPRRGAPLLHCATGTRPVLSYC